MKLHGNCDWCGKEIAFYPSKAKQKHHFCCRPCQHAFSNKRKNPERYLEYADCSKNSLRFTEMNRRLNPTRMTMETREKLREAHLNTGEGKTYTKVFGVHEHRVVAERILGRPLRGSEIVHHRNGDKRNNTPENLVVFQSQSEHAKHHMEMKWFLSELEKLEGGDAQ